MYEQLDNFDDDDYPSVDFLAAVRRHYIPMMAQCVSYLKEFQQENNYDYPRLAATDYSIFWEWLAERYPVEDSYQDDDMPRLATAYLQSIAGKLDKQILWQTLLASLHAPLKCGITTINAQLTLGFEDKSATPIVLQIPLNRQKITTMLELHSALTTCFSALVGSLLEEDIFEIYEKSVINLPGSLRQLLKYLVEVVKSEEVKLADGSKIAIDQNKKVQYLNAITVMQGYLPQNFKSSVAYDVAKETKLSQKESQVGGWNQ